MIAGLCATLAVSGIVTAVGKSNPLGQIVVALVVLSLSVAAVRWSRASVDTSGGQALVVRNPLRTHVVPWAQVSGFETKASSMRNAAPSRQLVTVQLTDGSSITCVGLCPWGGKPASKITAELNGSRDWSADTPLTERDRDTISRLEAIERAQHER